MQTFTHVTYKYTKRRNEVCYRDAPHLEKRIISWEIVTFLLTSKEDLKMIVREKFGDRNAPVLKKSNVLYNFYIFCTENRFFFIIITYFIEAY